MGRYTGRGGGGGFRREAVCMIRFGFGLYNIRNGRNGGLEFVLCGMSQNNMDLGIFQETKVMGGEVYTS